MIPQIGALDPTTTKWIVVQFTVEVEKTATDDDIGLMVGSAGVQFEEPADMEGNDTEFRTGRITANWWEVN